MTVEDAIRISKILAAAPDERIPMILSVLEKADVTIDGLEELEEWKAYKDMAAVIDLDEFRAELFEAFKGCEYKGGRRIPAAEFSEYCRKKKVKPTPLKRALAKKGYLKTSADGAKTNYTESAWIDGKAVRCVILTKISTGKKEEQKNET